MEFLFSLEGLISLLTLTVLEIVLGIDNIIFISIVAGKLPAEKQFKARLIGLSLALIMRIALLFAITWIIGLTKPLFTLFDFTASWRDLILFAGGLFLMAKSTTEIHSKVSGDEDVKSLIKKQMSFSTAVIQIVLLDIVFSFDSILTAIGLTKEFIIMVIAVVIALIIMLVFSGKVSNFVNNHPTVKILALSFLLMIGMLLVFDSFHLHVPKGYVYFSLAFSMFIEVLNLRMRKNIQKE
ncbi:MAG: TerC family protein [Bacteroidetes bacterium]|nr:TerC family protein [Bacteroidota bacterium]HET6244353.1 TerC family protein [Bacteroidia bacterium]